MGVSLDHSSPQYASYVQLCREIKVERSTIHDGDWWFCERHTVSEPFTLVGGEDYPVPLPEQGDFWLPSLGDWLEMLSEDGHDAISFARLGDGWGCQWIDGDFAIAPTREEAAARLWMEINKGDAK